MAKAVRLNSPIIKLAAVAGAYFLVADPVNAQVDKLLTMVMPNKDAAGNKIPGSVSTMGNWAGAAGEGFAGYKLMQSRGSMIKTALGAVLLAAGAKRALKATGVVSGYQRVPVIAGYQNVPVVGSADSGYRVNGPGNNGYRINGRNTSAVMGGIDTTFDGSLMG
jgi:hypothetical protein